jgi:hypothetical protein
MSDGQSPRWRAEIDFAAALSVTPPALTTAHLHGLEEQGWTRWPSSIYCNRRPFSHGPTA